MTAPNWNDLKADGRVVFDFPGRKLAVYPNNHGQIVFLMVQDGKANYFDMQLSELNDALFSIQAIIPQAVELERQREAEYQTFLAVEKAKGND